MAARFVVGLALFALCHSSPVLINEIRDGRSYSIAEGSASGLGGVNQATADVRGNVAHATGTTNNAGYARDGFYYPGKASANAQTRDEAGPTPVEIARNQGFYHPLHVAQPAVITYNQNFVPNEQLIYQPLSAAPASAQSSAIIDGASETSQSTATNYGGGAADSSAQTSGNYGLTNTNAKIEDGGYKTATSNAQTGLGVASVSSKAGSGVGNGYASSTAQTKGAGVAPIAQAPNDIIVEPTIIAAKNQGFYNPTTYGSASSNAIVNGYGSAAPARKSIHWHFGTAYDIPAGYGSIKSASPVIYQTPVVYQAAPVPVSPYGTAVSSSNTYGDGSGQSSAVLNAGSSSTRSTANSGTQGSATSNAGINNNGYGLYRSADVGSGIVKTTSNTNGLGFADSNASLNNGLSNTKSFAQSTGGSAKSHADISDRDLNLYRTAGVNGQWGKTISDAWSNGQGTAISDAQASPFGQKRANSSAKSNGWGSSFANTQIL